MPKTTKRQNTYKYRLYDLLFRKYGSDYLKGKEIISREVIKMSLSTVEKDFAIRSNEARVIPHPRLQVYANHFEVSPEDLKAKRPKKSRV